MVLSAVSGIDAGAKGENGGKKVRIALFTVFGKTMTCLPFNG